MRHKGNFRRVAALAAGALAAGLLAVGGPAAPALAGPVAASPAASTTTYDLEAGASVKALGYTWNLGLGATGSGVAATLDTDNNGASEFHGWDSTPSFAPTAAKDLAVTSTGYATLKTGSALSPVLAVSLAFTPVKAQNVPCAKGSATAYTGYVTGTATLATGLRGVTISAPFSQASGPAVLNVDESCAQPPAPNPPCAGGGWSAATAGLAGGTIGTETLGTAPSWGAALVKNQVTTASPYLVRSDQVIISSGEPAPRLNPAAHTVSVTTSGAITGSAVISYTSASTPAAATCYVGSQEYTETGVQYTGTTTTTAPFQASTILTGTLSLTPGNSGNYADVTLQAK